MNSLITLIAFSGEPDGGETGRTVFCAVRSVGQREFYEAGATGYKPELKFVLDDLDYRGEDLCRYEDRLYRVLRTYRAGQTVELTVTRASEEEGERYGEED